MPNHRNWSKEFNCSHGSKKYELAVYRKKMRGLYGYKVLKHPKRCRRCTRESTIIHAETGLTMQCFIETQQWGRACDGTAMPEIVTRESHLAIEEAASRDTTLRTAPEELTRQGAKRTDRGRCDGTTNPAA